MSCKETCCIDCARLIRGDCTHTSTVACTEDKNECKHLGGVPCDWFKRKEECEVVK